MQFSSMLVAGAIASMVSVGSAQLNSTTGCVGNLNLNPVQCTLSWIFFMSEESPSDDTIQTYINTSSCEKLLEGDGLTKKVNTTSVIPASYPGLTLNLTITNPLVNSVGPVFIFNGTRYDICDCVCGVGPNTVSASTAFACSCPFACSAFNNVRG